MIKVLNDKVLVKVATEEEVTESGIILTSAKHERKYEGIVTAVGDNPDIAKNGIEVGSYVFYPKGLNTPVKVKDEEYDLVSIYDIIAVGTED